MGNYIPTIGIECHVQLATQTKLFSGADNDARDKPANTTVSPICFGLPGTLPVLNTQAVTLALKAGAALNAELPLLSRFERKHYFYPDLPKGYQITQLAEPVIGKGQIDIILPDGKKLPVRIHHAHLEEDAGKLTHPAGANYSLVDLNRAGTPLIEIVSEADMHSPAEARAYAEELYRLMTYTDVTHGDLYHGNMRFDVNMSVALPGDPLGTRTETKNLNSFRAVEKAAEYEISRQIQELERGNSINQETRGWDEAKQITVSQRSKEDAHDYRYFPDADIPPVIVTESQINVARASLPMLPMEYRSRWSELGLDSGVIETILTYRSVAEYMLSLSLKNEAKHIVRIAHWITSTFESVSDVLSLNGAHLIELSEMVEAKELSSTNAKLVLTKMSESDAAPRDIATDNNLIQVNDDAFITTAVKTVLDDPASEKAIQDIRSGNDKAIGYLVGQVMKQSKGKANPGAVQEIIRKKLEEMS